MKNELLLVILCVIAVTSLISVNAIGLNYNLNNLEVNSGESFCIDNYKIFNTDDFESSGYLTVDNELINFIDNNTERKVITVPGLSQEIKKRYINDSQGMREYLRNNNLIYPYHLCLRAPKVAKNECNKTYEGNVVLIPKTLDNQKGSSLSSSVSAPLKITIRCNEKQQPFLLFILLPFGLIIIALGIYYGIRYKKIKDLNKMVYQNE